MDDSDFNGLRRADLLRTKVTVGVLYRVQQPRLYWDRSSALSLVGVEPTQR